VSLQVSTALTGCCQHLLARTFEFWRQFGVRSSCRVVKGQGFVSPEFGVVGNDVGQINEVALSRAWLVFG